jgi:acyl transferase domain-containing protein
VGGKLNTKKLATLKPGTKTADGGGLYAISGPPGRITWGFLFTINRRRRLMSLGQWPDVSLATARELATDARRKVHAGIDPIEDRKAEKRQVPTFNEVADELIRSKTPAWKSPRSKDQWRQRLRDYAKPLLTSHRQGRFGRRPWRAQAPLARKAGDGFKGPGDDRGRL